MFDFQHLPLLLRANDHFCPLALSVIPPSVLPYISLEGVLAAHIYIGAPFFGAALLTLRDPL